MEFKNGFDKTKFEADHFVFRRGSGEKYFHGWDDVRYHGSLSPSVVNQRDLEHGNMSLQLFDFLSHVYGEEGMKKYFPAPEATPVRKPTLHFSIGSAMANGVGKPIEKALATPQPKKNAMSDAELDDLAIRLFGSINDINALNAQKQK